MFLIPKIKRVILVLITSLRYYKSVQGAGITIKNSKILGINNSFLSNTFIKDSQINGNVSIHNNTKIINSSLKEYSKIGSDCAFVSSCIGDFSYINDFGAIINAKIGKFCSIGPNLKVGLGNHPTRYLSTSPIFYSNQSWFGNIFTDQTKFEEHENTIIGNDVWIGANVFIVDGIKIGNGAIVGAGAVVTKDVPDYAIVGGVPAKLIKFRFSDDIIKVLQELKWWDKDMDWLKSNLQHFQKDITSIPNFKN